MCNTTSTQLKYILENINTFSFNEINNFVEKEGLELSCLIKYSISPDLLNKLDLDVLKRQIDIESITKEQLLSAGMNEVGINYLFNKQDEDEVEVEDEVEDEDEDEDEDDNNDLISNINKGRTNVSDLQEALLNGAITTSELITKCNLTDKMIKRIKDYSPLQMPTVQVSDLPPMKLNCTDFYFLGLPASGKSCLIASLLTYWMRTGNCNPEVSNPRGVKYFRTLAGGFSKGILPKNNPRTFIDHIEVTLKQTITTKGFFGNTKTRKTEIPINILDMAGERFEDVADRGSESFEHHKKFLNNNNYKSLFFILDYSADAEGSESFNQNFTLNLVLNILKDMGVLEKTDSIFLLVTKADMFNASNDKYHECALKYIDDYYGSFKNNLEDTGIPYEILPYSIGPCIFGQLLEDYNPRTNEKLEKYPSILTEKIEILTARYGNAWVSL